MSSTREKLIRLLVVMKEKDQYISGQQLSEALHISRTSVWKYMNDLKQDGFMIKAVPNKGYRIDTIPDKLSVNAIQWGLETSWLGQKVIHKESTSSTQYLAHDLARKGAEHGTIIVADEQTAGRGRLNRKWQSTKGKGIWLSVILRPDMMPHLAPQLTLLTAGAVAEAITELTGLQPQIKWPNDLLFNGKKAVGILTEMQAEQDRIQYVIIGIGVNVNQSMSDFDDTLTHATSLSIETGQTWNVIQIMQQILLEFEKLYKTYNEHGFKPVKDKWEQYAFQIGKWVTIKTQNNSSSAILRGIADDGALRIEQDNQIKKIYSAEIEWHG